eukprot:64978_1
MDSTAQNTQSSSSTSKKTGSRKKKFKVTIPQGPRRTKGAAKELNIPSKGKKPRRKLRQGGRPDSRKRSSTTTTTGISFFSDRSGNKERSGNRERAGKIRIDVAERTNERESKLDDVEVDGSDDNDIELVYDDNFEPTYPPVTLPFAKPTASLPSSGSTSPEMSDSSDIKVRDGVDAAGDSLGNLFLTDIHQAEQSTSFSSTGSQDLVFVQLPSHLPLVSEAEPESGRPASDIGNMHDGEFGELVILRSGKVKMIVGDVVMDVTEGVRPSCFQELMSVHPENKKIFELGSVTRKLVCSYDIEHITRDMHS